VLKALRKAKGLNQVQLAKQARITTAYVNMLESGKKGNPSLAILQRLAKALGVPITHLLS
jgi:transcriptional regulator with XRE-family HTH domain